MKVSLDASESQKVSVSNWVNELCRLRVSEKENESKGGRVPPL